MAATPPLGDAWINSAAQSFTAAFSLTAGKAN